MSEQYEGFGTSYDKPTFPNIYSDSTEIHKVAEWSLEAIEYKTNQYGAFLQREDPMPRAVEAANKILDYLLFELAYRDGIYTPDMGRLEDEACDGSPV